jgi:hypothetical protein
MGHGDYRTKLYCKDMLADKVAHLLSTRTFASYSHAVERVDSLNTHSVLRPVLLFCRSKSKNWTERRNVLIANLREGNHEYPCKWLKRC